MTRDRYGRGITSPGEPPQGTGEKQNCKSELKALANRTVYHKYPIWRRQSRVSQSMLLAMVAGLAVLRPSSTCGWGMLRSSVQGRTSGTERGVIQAGGI